MEGIDIIIFFMLSFIIGLLAIWWLSDLISNIKFNKHIKKAKREINEGRYMGCSAPITSGRAKQCDNK